jgi:hypothetical protein
MNVMAQLLVPSKHLYGSGKWEEELELFSMIYTLREIKIVCHHTICYVSLFHVQTSEHHVISNIVSLLFPAYNRFQGYGFPDAVSHVSGAEELSGKSELTMTCKRQ